MRLNDDGRTVSAMDALAPGIGEIIGGSQREERLEILDRSMVERGIDREHLCLAAICAAMARCRRPLPNPPPLAGREGWGASSAPSPTSPALPTCATRSPSREPPATRNIDRATLYALPEDRRSPTVLGRPTRGPRGTRGKGDRFQSRAARTARRQPSQPGA